MYGPRSEQIRHGAGTLREAMDTLGTAVAAVDGTQYNLAFSVIDTRLNTGKESSDLAIMNADRAAGHTPVSAEGTCAEGETSVAVECVWASGFSDVAVYKNGLRLRRYDADVTVSSEAGVESRTVTVTVVNLIPADVIVAEYVMDARGKQIYEYEQANQNVST